MRSLLDFWFEGRRQLIIYRVPSLSQERSAGPDHAHAAAARLPPIKGTAHLAHLDARDDHTPRGSRRAPQEDIARLKARMGWEMPWYTMTDNFDVDFGVDQWHGHNAFIHDGDKVFRTYFINSRGDEAMGSTWSYLDMTALGRQETWENSPKGYPQTQPYKWWNWRDNYDEATPHPLWVDIS